MPSIIYGGLKYNQIRHAIYCKNCKETIESHNYHDLKYCSCKLVGIDGGLENGNRILGDKINIENRSVYRAIIKNKYYYIF
jgi:hypothetical protein